MELASLESPEDPVDSRPSYKIDALKLYRLLLALSVALFFFVVIPIIATLPYYSYPWLNVGDLWKAFDPIVTLPLFYFILHQSPLFRDPAFNETWHAFGVKLLFLVGAGVYIEGHGMHTICTIIKDPLKDLMETNPEISTQYPRIEEIYNYIRDDWQHLYSHYIYVSGVLLMTVAHLIAFHNYRGARLNNRELKWTMAGAVLMYGILFAGVAINFPQGLAVGWTWIFLVVVAYVVIKYRSMDTNWRELYLGRDMMWHFYLVSYGVALIIMIIYAIIFGWVDRASAGIPLH